MGSETQQSVSEWAVKTFGDDGSDLRCATRANEEMAELLSCLSRPDPDMRAVATELADVCIVLWRLGTRLGVRLVLGPVYHSPSAWESPLRWVLNANKEMAEVAYWLGIKPGSVTDGMAYDTARRCLEVCWIRLQWAAEAGGVDLWYAIDQKMAVNRARTWKLDGSGHGYHVKAGAE